MHKWSKEDDIVTFYLYRFGTDSLRMELCDISKKLGMSESSLKMRIGNFKAIDTGKGLSNYAKLSKKVYDEYKNFNKDSHLKEVNNILK